MTDGEAKQDHDGPRPDRCGGKKKQGPGWCTQPHGWGTDHQGIGHCKLHGGKTPTHKKAAQKIQVMELARRIAGTDAPPADPVDVVLKSIAASWWNVSTYEALVTELPTHPEDDELVVGPDGIAHWKRGNPGLYGRTYHQSGVPTGEAKKHILLQMLDDERDRAAKLAHDAVKLGIEERRLRLAEADAKSLFTGVSEALAAIKVTREQQEEFRRVLSAFFRRTETPVITR
jgi:hypothetical protein